jgi:hypothetical protein
MLPAGDFPHRPADSQAKPLKARCTEMFYIGYFVQLRKNPSRRMVDDCVELSWLQ